MVNFLSEVIHIQFDGTFYTVPLQFYQSWTIFITVGTKSFSGIHSLMASKEERLYKSILDCICSKFPYFQPKMAISDWEIAPRKVLKAITLK